MASGRVLKKLFLMSALASALLVAAPAQAERRHLGESHDYGHRGGWDHNRGRGDHHWRHGRGHDGWRHGGGGHEWRHGWGGHGHHWQGRGWGYAQPYHYAPPRYHAPPRYYRPRHHSHYRGCGHDGYYHGGLVEFLVDYSRYD